MHSDTLINRSRRPSDMPSGLLGANRANRTVELGEDLLEELTLEKSRGKKMTDSSFNVGKQIFLKIPNSIGVMSDEEIEVLATQFYLHILGVFETKVGTDED